MFDTLLWIGGALLAVAGMVFAALKQGEKSGRQKVELELEKQNVQNEKKRDTIEDRIRNDVKSDPGKLRSPYDRD